MRSNVTSQHASITHTMHQTASANQKTQQDRSCDVTLGLKDFLTLKDFRKIKRLKKKKTYNVKRSRSIFVLQSLGKMLFGLHQSCPLQYHRWPPGNYIFNVLCARRRHEIKLKNCCQKNISCALSPFLLAASARARGSFATVKLVGSWTSGELNQFANDLMPA